MPKQIYLEKLSTLPYFTLESFKQITGINNEHTQTARVQLVRWHKVGLILRIKRGMYMTRVFYEQHAQEADFHAAMSAILHPQSYLSSLYILQQAGILTEATFPITAITYKNTRTFINDLGTFTYQHIDERFYEGFSARDYYGITFFQASPAKALFDYLYLRPQRSLERNKTYNLGEELRLNLEFLSRDAREEFEAHVTRSASPKMINILQNFQSYIWRT